MFSRLLATWLIVLVVAPFTAPFQTCDLTSLVGGRTRQLPIVPPAAAALSSDATMPNVPVASTAGRTRLSPLIRMSAALGKIASAPTVSPSFVQSSASAHRIEHRVVLATVLRL